MDNGNLLLTDAQIKQKILRIAWEIYENNVKEKELIIAGVYDKGYKLAKRLIKAFNKISPIETTLVRIDIDKSNQAQSEVSLDCEVKDLRNKVVILVDDVLNTGKTFAYSMKPFLNVKVKRIEVAVLVNRSHTAFPIQPSYTGYEVATTLNEHIDVRLDKEKGVYLI